MPKVERLPSGSYRIRFVDPWGRRAVITRHTAADTRAAYKRALGDMARGEYIDTRQGRITLEAWADEWLAGARNLSAGGHDTYRRDLDRHILPALGRVPVGRLSAGDIDRYLTQIGQVPGRGFEPPGAPGIAAFRTGDLKPSSPAHRSSAPATRGLAPSTVHRHYRTLHRMLEVARLRGLIAKNPTEHVQPPVVPRVQRPVLDPEQIDQLADTISPRYRAWLYVMCYGGLRWSESVGLRRMDIRTKAGCDGEPESNRLAASSPPLALQQSQSGVEPTARQNRDHTVSRDLGMRILVAGQLIHRARGEWDRVEPKAGSRRTVTLPAFAATELAAHLDEFSLPGPDGLVFPTRNGTPVQSPSFTANVFKRALQRAGLPDMRIHDLRHTAVSLVIDAGIHPKLGQARAGHASSALHMDLYGHLYVGADQAVADALEELRAASMRRHLHAV